MSLSSLTVEKELSTELRIPEMVPLEVFVPSSLALAEEPLPNVPSTLDKMSVEAAEEVDGDDVVDEVEAGAVVDSVAVEERAKIPFNILPNED